MDNSSDVQLINFETFDTVASVVEAIDAAISSAVKDFNLLDGNNDVTHPNVPLIDLTQDSEEEREPGASDGDSTPANSLTQDSEEECVPDTSGGDSTSANSLTQDSDANSTTAQDSKHDSGPNSSSDNFDDQTVPDSTELEPPRKKTKKSHHTAPPNTPVSFYGHDSDHDADDESDDVTICGELQLNGLERNSWTPSTSNAGHTPYHFPQEEREIDVEELGLNPEPIDVADNTQMRSVDSLSEGVRPREQRLNPDEIDRLLRSGGFVNGYRITPRPRFNGATLRRTMNLREINSTDLVAYHSYLHDMLNDIVAFARDFGGIAIEVIMQGCKLVYMYDPAFKQRYLDSYSFFPMGLAKMPAALDLKTTEKGYFPHLFNTRENINYFGPYPDKKFYNYDNMSDKDQQKFDSWYSTVQGKFFCFRRQLYEYGVNDVLLLREGCMKYRSSFIECTGVDPFSFTTIASCAMGIFKTHFLEKNTLALTHNKAYVRQSKCYSSASIEWLEYVKKTRNVDLHHALNHGEVSIGKFFLDGYYEQDGVRHGLEFNGCSWHGCSCRYEPYHRHPLSGLPYGVLRSQFDDKVEILQKAYGLQIEVMWECRWNKMKKTDPSVIDFMTDYNAPERLKPRDALFGGRTNAYKLYHKAAEGEKIRCQGKLMFPLCRTCAQEQNQTTSCSHNDHERALSGCWVSIELLKAVEKGYVIAKIDEVWHFPQQSNTLFAGYVKTFLRLKQQASGYPSNVRTDAEKEAYVRQYFEKEGIRLDPKQISFNAAQRAITKLILNSLWGRFSLRENLPKTTLVSEPEDFTSIVFGNTESLSYFRFISDDVALVQHKPGKDDLCKTRDVNVFIGAFTTAYARLELYELMDRLGDRLLYSDTDSVIFVSRDGDWEPPLGDHLGELTSEVDEDDFLSSFCSSGPKSYAFETAKGKTCMKAKGITLNAKNSRVINMESLIGLVEGYVMSQDSSKHILAHSENIVRHKKTLTLHNKSVVKSFKVVYNKRRLLPDFTTLPYGY
ncbi:extracellular sulfatase Sulf-2 [Pimephales promelas]|nr:extracellular sulfatase Sulf-2 [Pimephales promelas]